MPTRKAFVIAAREFVSRIKSKGFWIGTLALPLLMAGLLALPALFITQSSFTHRLVVVDESGLVAERLLEELSDPQESDKGVATFELSRQEPSSDAAKQKEELNARIVAGEIDAWVWIPENVLEESRVDYHAESVSNILTQSILRSSLTRIVRKVRFEAAGYDPDAIGSLLASVQLETVRVTEAGEKKEGFGAAFAIAYFLALLLYMLIVLYGQQVLNGVIEEKTSRVVEVVLSTVSTFDLMLGKLIGIGLAGLTQVTIWIGASMALTAPGVVGAMATLPEEFEIPEVSPWLLFNFGVFFILGYFVYCTFYAAVGAAFNNVQEAQQTSIIGVAFLIVPLMMMIVIINDPDSLFATIMSLIPPFTPILMVLRLAVKSPPLWQVLLSYLLTGLFALFMVWIAARIYRVGVLMYGKKPNLREIVRWVRHS